nr:cytochrome P450 CYP4BN80 [Monolepta hieroglyphica]
MGVVISIVVGLLVVGISYWWMKIHRIRSKLKWIPEIPRTFLLGNISELNNTTVVLKTFRRYLEQHNGLCTIELGTYKFIVASDPTFLEFVLGRTEILNKTDEYAFFDNWLGTGLLTSREKKWKKTRKMLTPSFHFSVLESFTDTFETNGDILVEILEKETDKESVDIFPFIAMSALDTICETAMGVSINAQRNPKSEYVYAVDKKCKLLIERTFSPIKTFSLLYMLTPEYYEDRRCVNILHKQTMGVIRSRKAELKKTKKETQGHVDDIGIRKKKVFLDLLLEATLDGRPLTDTEIREEVDTFMFAGHDTSASAMSFCLYCLSKHKDVQDRIIQEQKQIFGDSKDRHATYRDLQEMKYLEMAIKESLRLYPSVPYTGRKTDRDVVYKDGNIIPKDTGILIVIFCANRNPKYFPDPDKYDPSRFEDTTAGMAPYTYLPFSAGPRNCIGQKFAWNLMKSILSKVLRNYEVQSCGHELSLAAETVLRSENGIKVKLAKRDWNKI